MKSHNAAIYLLSSRTRLLYKCLDNLFKNWNNKYQYPVYIHYFDNIYSESYAKDILSKLIIIIDPDNQFFDYHDNIIVTDACTNRIQIFDSQGNHLMTNRDFGNENNETIEFTWSSENYGMLVIAGTELQVYKRTKL